MSRLAVAALAAAAVAVAGCAGDDSGSSVSTGPLTSADASATTTPVTAPDALPASKPGTGAVSVGGATSSFAVQTCQVEESTDANGLTTLAHVTGTGTTAGGVPFTIEVKRFSSGTDPVTFTDTVDYTDTAKLLQALRYEVNGQVNDLRDEAARSAMIRTRAGGLSAQGIAGPPGEPAGGQGIVGIAVDATCPS